MSEVRRVDTTREHSCAICESPEYKQAETIIQRSGLKPDQWGFLLHDIADTLMRKGAHPDGGRQL